MGSVKWQDIKWVATGIIIGHAVCTGMAVLGGRILASAISVQTGKIHIA